MNVKIPFLTTEPEEDLLFVFLLTPVWWFLGFSIFIYHTVAVLAFLKTVSLCFRRQAALKFPKAAVIYAFFLTAYLASILINAGIRPADRIFASFNNLAQLLVGLLVLIVVYNSDPDKFFLRFFRNAKRLAVITGVLGVLFTALWFLRGDEMEVRALLGTKIPALMGMPYFYNMLHIKGAMTDFFVSTKVPRLVLYSDAPTATGGLMLCLWPAAMAWQALQGKGEMIQKTLAAFTWALCAFVIVFSMSRSAFCSIISAWVFVRVFEKRERIVAALFFLVIAVLLSGYIFQALEWLFNMRQSSNAGRFELYQDALKVVVRENVLMGVGIHLREGFTLRSLGSHSLYIEFFLVSGLVGLITFVLFQIKLVLSWFKLQRILQNSADFQIWKYLGIALLAMSLWLIGDTLVALPVITYAYFMIAGGILLLEQKVKPC